MEILCVGNISFSLLHRSGRKPVIAPILRNEMFLVFAMLEIWLQLTVFLGESVISKNFSLVKNVNRNSLKYIPQTSTVELMNRYNVCYMLRFYFVSWWLCQCVRKLGLKEGETIGRLVGEQMRTFISKYLGSMGSSSLRMMRKNTWSIW